MGNLQPVETQYVIQYKRRGLEQSAGSGSFGEVRACTHNTTHKLRAIKTIEKKHWSTRRQVLDEIAVLQSVARKHPNVIEFIEYFEEWTAMNLIFEFCPKGSLEDALSSSSLRSSEATAAPLFRQVIDALVFLRGEGILHRDVKPANLLFADDRTLKLADFGTACRATEGEPLTKVEGTPAFFAPEQHQLPRGKGYSFPVDMWAAGISLYMLLFQGKHPFTEGDIMIKNKVRGGDFETGWMTSSRAHDLLAWTLMPNPDQRIRPEEASEHLWFASHGLGAGAFTKTRPQKLILDSHGNWCKTYY